MAKNDYYVIVYKILTYLYECMKAGKRPEAEDFNWNCEMFSIPQSYWTEIMKELSANGYVKGIVEVSALGGESGVKVSHDVAITMKGVEFLQDNNMMAKAKEFLGKGIENVILSIIGRII